MGPNFVTFGDCFPDIFDPGGILATHLTAISGFTEITIINRKWN
jgi:hypothetical protein